MVRNHDAEFWTRLRDMIRLATMANLLLSGVARTPLGFCFLSRGL
jgi:hypothetical protein